MSKRLLAVWVTTALVGAGSVAADTPSAPTDVKVSAVKNSEMSITWKKEGYGDATQMAIFRTSKKDAKPLKESPADWLEVKKASAKEGKFADSVVEFSSYRYTLQAVEGDKKSEPVATDEVYAGLPAPTELSVAPQVGFVEISWKYTEASAEFEIQRRDGNDAGFKHVVKTKESTFTDSEARENGFAAYRVRALANGGELSSKFTTEQGVRTARNDWYLEPGFLQDNRYDPESVNRIVYCTFISATDSAPARWKCDPAAAVYISADEVSTIVLQNLPAGVVRLSASLSEGGPGAISSGKAGDRSFDQVAYEKGRSPSVAAVDLYKYRRFNASFASQWSVSKAELPLEVQRVREQGLESRGDGRDRGMDQVARERVSLFARSQDSVVLISLQNEQGLSMSLPPIELVYQRWWIDLGGFYAFRQLSDEEIVTEPLPAVEGESAKVQVLRVSDGHDWESDTGVMTTFFPANYPMIGASFGIAENSGRSLSYYLGGAIRLRGRRGAAAATVSVGVALAPVRRFPGVNTKDGDLGAPVAEDANYVYDATSPLLSGEIRNEIRPFAAITLGFALDRRSSKSGPKE